MRFQASGSPGTVFEVPGERSQRRRQAILTRLSAKTAPDIAKRTRLSAKRAIGDSKATLSLETVSKQSRPVRPRADVMTVKVKYRDYEGKATLSQKDRLEDRYRTENSADDQVKWYYVKKNHKLDPV